MSYPCSCGCRLEELAVFLDGSTYGQHKGQGVQHLSKTGLVSVWFKRDPGSQTLNPKTHNPIADQMIFETYTTNDPSTGEPLVSLSSRSDGTVRIAGRFGGAPEEQNGGCNCVLSGISGPTQVGLWHHVLVAWDNAKGYLEMYVDDQRQALEGVTQHDVAVVWDEAFYSFGARHGRYVFLGCLAELYLSRGFLDITLESSRRMFSSAGAAGLSLIHI